MTNLDIYRKVPIVDDSREHILQAGLGCGIARRGLIDATTNSAFGATIDKAILEDLALFRSLVGVESARGSPIAVQNATGDLELVGGSEPKRIREGKPWSVEQLADGLLHVGLDAPNLERARQLMSHALAELRASPDEIVHRTATRVREFPESQRFRLHLGGSLHMRAVAKACFNMAADVLGTTAVLGPSFDDLRQFVLQGVDQGTDALRLLDRQAVAPIGWEHRSEIFNSLPKLTDSPFEHSVAVRACGSAETVYSLVTLFGHLRYSVLLSNGWRGRDACYLLRAAPDPEHRSADLAEVDPALCPGLRAEQVVASEPKLEAVAASAERLGRAGQERQETLQHQAIFDAVRNDVLGPDDGSEITREQAEAFAQRYVREVVRLAERMPTTESVDLGESPDAAV